MQHRLVRVLGRIRRAQGGRSVWNVRLRLWHGFGLLVFISILALVVGVFDVTNAQRNESTAFVLSARNTTQQPPPSSTSTAAATNATSSTTSSTTSSATPSTTSSTTSSTTPSTTSSTTLSTTSSTTSSTTPSTTSSTTSSTSTTTRQTSTVATSTKRKTTAARVAPTLSYDVFDTCPLPDRDPWDQEVWKMHNPKHDQFDTCTVKTKVYTRWGACDNGTVVWNETETGLAELRASSTCTQRCVHFKNAFAVKLDEWKFLEPAVNLNCEVVEVLCVSLSNNTTTYRFLHQRIVKPVDLPTSSSKSWRPNVIVFTLDSVSHTQSERQLTKTLKLLRLNHDIVSFPWLNKVALNSRVNAIPLFFGEHVTKVERAMFGLPDLQPNMTENESCHTPLNNLTGNIYEIFAKAGYRTISSEDWSKGVLNWPNCDGVLGQLTHHYYSPLHRRVDDDEDLKRRVFKELCKAPYHQTLDYTSQFIEAYQDQPKFVQVWLVDTAHDYFNRLFRVDGELEEWMKRHQKVIDDSFLIFNGDHGMRFGEIAKTALGKIENNNPMLHIAVPRRLRDLPQSSYVWNLKTNAERIVTHFDLHATLRDIVETLPLSNFTNTTTLQRTSNRYLARSLLRRIPGSEKRNCKTLPISFDYCLCSYESIPIKDAKAIRTIGERLVRRLNDILESHNVTEICAPLVYHNSTETVEYSFTGSGFFHATVTVQPSGGLFQTRFALREDNRLVGANTFDRLDSYGSQSHCVKDDAVRHICYCKKQKS